MKRIIIGLTGAFGSGTSFISERFFVPKGYKKCSLSQVLRDEFTKQKGINASCRQDLQEFGNELREKEPFVLARIVDEEFISKDNESNFVIESIRNPAEIQYFRERYPEFILIGIFADYDTRWDRVKAVYQNSRDKFDRDEQKDKGTYEPKYGQKISDCFFESDLILSNNELINGKNEAFNEMKKKIDGYLIALDDPANSNPTLKETLMAAAYTSGRRSKCFKRKVGAIIADKYDRIISSGFNGVPKGLTECKPSFGECYRDIKRKSVAKRICCEAGLDVADSSEFEDVVKKNVKLLELCRALHGEESAIMNLVGRSADLERSTIYVTTYPCNLCANKIVQAGIKNVVYFEPYPVEEAKVIFKEAGIKTEPFEGVTFRAFFRFFQFQP